MERQQHRMWSELLQSVRCRSAVSGHHERPRRCALWSGIKARSEGGYLQQLKASTRFDYAKRAYPSLFSPNTTDASPSQPVLLLAPMENLADASMRRALASTAGGFDEACTEFIRCPDALLRGGSIQSMARGLTRHYNPAEMGEVPLAAQIMGTNPEVLGAAAVELAHRGAPRVDLNCGCPANTVTGKGAGSSLLRTPEALEAAVRGMVVAVAGRVPVTVKMRSGYADTALFRENLAAAQQGGAAAVTVHPRTKAQSYRGGADWDLIALAKSLLHIPVIGNGDVTTVAKARQLLQHTGCDGIMIGRGAVQDPLLFRRIRTAFSRPDGDVDVSWADEAAMVEGFLRRYHSHNLAASHNPNSTKGFDGRAGKLKQVCSYLFASPPQLRAALQPLLRCRSEDVSPEQLLELLCAALRQHWQPGGPAAGGAGQVQVDHFATGAERVRVVSDYNWTDRNMAAGTVHPANGQEHKTTPGLVHV